MLGPTGLALCPPATAAVCDLLSVICCRYVSSQANHGPGSGAAAARARVAELPALLLGS